jgi:hypothetical protein
MLMLYWFGGVHYQPRPRPAVAHTR